MADPLIPDDVRKLYEDLIIDGSRLLTDGQNNQWDPVVDGLLTRGLAITVAFEPPLLLPADPRAAFARLLLRWQERVDGFSSIFTRWLDAMSEMQRTTVTATANKESPSCALIAGKAHVGAMRSVLARTASTRVRTCDTGPYGEPRLLPNGEPHRLRTVYAPLPAGFIDRGGRWQALMDQETATRQRETLPDAFQRGEEIRIVEEKLPMKLLLVDDHTALVPLGPYGYPCLLIRDRELVSALGKYFSAFWERGIPWVPDSVERPRKDTSLRKSIIDGLASGLKDEAIARQQGISVRTVRRHASGLMQDLGVTTRFAAGVAAVRQGLVAETPRPRTGDGPLVSAPSSAGIDH